MVKKKVRLEEFSVNILKTGLRTTIMNNVGRGDVSKWEPYFIECLSILHRVLKLRDSHILLKVCEPKGPLSRCFILLLHHDLIPLMLGTKAHPGTKLTSGSLKIPPFSPSKPSPVSMLSEKAVAGSPYRISSCMATL